MRANDVIRAALDVADQLPDGELEVFREYGKLIVRIQWGLGPSKRNFMIAHTKESLENTTVDLQKAVLRDMFAIELERIYDYHQNR